MVPKFLVGKFFELPVCFLIRSPTLSCSEAFLNFAGLQTNGKKLGGKQITSGLWAIINLTNYPLEMKGQGLLALGASKVKSHVKGHSKKGTGFSSRQGDALAHSSAGGMGMGAGLRP